jgi:Iap family predicted aminopeptidase
MPKWEDSKKQHHFRRGMTRSILCNIDRQHMLAMIDYDMKYTTLYRYLLASHDHIIHTQHQRQAIAVYFGQMEAKVVLQSR